MSQFNHQQSPPLSYPAPPPQQAPFVAPPPLGYPMKNAGDNDQPPRVLETKHRGFGKGCCAGLCCCCLLDACF